MPEVQAATLMATDLPPWLDTPAVRGAFDRIGVPVEYAAPNFNLYFHTVDGIESTFGKNLSNKERVGAGGTTAKGRYQITDGTYETMLNRAIRTYKMVDAEPPKWMLDAKKDTNRDPRDLNNNQSKELILLDMEQRPQKGEDGVGSSALMAELAMGNWDAGKRLFYEHHHTDPDQDTIDRAEEYFGRFSPDVTTVLEEQGREPATSILARQTGQEYATPDLSTTPSEPEPTPELEEVTPTQRGQIPILGVGTPRRPQRSGMFSDITVDARRVDETAPPLPALDPVVPTQRGQVPIPNPDFQPPVKAYKVPAPRLAPQSEPRLQSELSAMTSSALEPAPQRQPEPAPAPVLEEVVPTQRGQVPIPERPSAEPERKVGSEPRLESELASGMMSDGVGSTEPASPEQILSSPEEVSLGVNITTPRVDRASVQDYPDPTVTVDTESPIPQQAIQVERSLQFEKPEKSPSATQIDFDKAGRAAADSRPKPVLSDDALEQAARTAVPTNREYQSAGEYLLKNTARNLANYGTLNTYDYIEAGYRSLLGEEYDDVFKSIREDRRRVESAYPISQLAGEIGAGGLTGNALFNAGKRVAGPAGITSLELGTYMGLSGDTNQERLELATMGSIMGYGLGSVIHLATRPAKPGKPSARTEADDQLDDDWVEQNINTAIKDGTTLLYRTNNGDLKRVTPIKSINKYNDKKPNPRYYNQNDEVIVRDERGNEFAVAKEKVERVNLTGANTKKFEASMKFENSNYQFKPPRQVLKEKYNEDGSLMLTKEGEEAVANGEPLTASMVQMELRDATWRDARTAGELWDSLVEGGKKLYADLVRGSDDTLYQKVSKQVGNFYQIASTTAGRQTTKDFVMIGQPLTPLSKIIDKDKYLKGFIGDVTNRRALIDKYKGTQYQAWIIREITPEKLRAYIAKNYGEENAKAWDAYVEWNYGKKEVHVDYLSGMEQFRRKNSPDVHIHMSLTKEAREKALRASNNRSGKQVEYDPLSRDDSALEKRTRGSFLLGQEFKLSDAPVVDDYLNPIFTDFRRTANLEQLYQIAKKFGLKIPDLDSGEQAYKVFQRLEEDLVRRGINPQAAKYAAKIMSDDFVGGTRTPNGWLQALNSIGYAGSLAGFKSAVLNLHDIPMAAVLYGPSSFRGIANVKGISVTDQGIRQNVGEFRDRMIESMRTGEMSPAAYAAMVTRKGTDILMQGTGFSFFDTVGKNSISKMIVQNAVDTVDELEKRWGFYFDERQIGVLKSQIQKHGTDLTKYSREGSELMEELFFAGLGQQQLIAMSGRPAAWARHPNFRMMWALRGFAIKQLALAEKNVVDNILEGNIKEAVDYMKRYVIFAAGSFGLLNEARQWMWGDGNFTAGGVLMGMGDQIISTASINTIGLNDYQWGRMMRNGIALTFLESLIPIGIDIPKDIILDAADAFDGSVKNVDNMTVGQRVAYPFTQFPIVKQTGRMFDNLADTRLFGIDIKAPLPQPMDQFNRKFILTESGPRESDG